MKTLLDLIATSQMHWFASPEWWLVVFAFITLIVVIVQTGATAKAAKAARDAASAAKLAVDAANRQAATMEAQTRALIASERAWLTVTVDKVLRGDARLHGQDFVTLTAQCTIRNLGKTPARFTGGAQASLIMLDSGNSLNSLPHMPDLATAHRMGPIPEFIPGLGSIELNLDLSCEGIWMGTLLVVYGVIRYKHVLSDAEVQTTFGYNIDRNSRLERLPSEFSEYNKSV